MTDTLQLPEITVVAEWPASMAEVADRVRLLPRTARPESVVARLRVIQRLLDGEPKRRLGMPVGRRRDGVGCFNGMYLRVTEEICRRADEFESPAFVQRLAVVFAEFYFSAYEAVTHGRWVSKAWEPLFQDRAKKGVAPIQFALAGMNAHINNDLPWALVQSWEEFDLEPRDDGPEHRDFDLVNEILAGVQAEVRAKLETGFVRWLDRAFGRLDDIVANVSIAKARSEAWERAARWRDGLDLRSAAAHERHVGYESHLILVA